MSQLEIIFSGLRLSSNRQFVASCLRFAGNVQLGFKEELRNAQAIVATLGRRFKALFVASWLLSLIGRCHDHDRLDSLG